MATITTSQAQQLLIAEARKHVGYNPGKTYSKFGAWYGWPNALWCAAFGSKIFYDAFGYDAAVAGIGHESTAPHKRGWIWTVAWRQWFLQRNLWVGVRNAQPGDLMFFKYPTSGGRADNPVNHVDVVEANHYSKGYITTIGGNTPRPGTPGDPSNGRGCWRHNRSIHDRYIVAVYRPDWAALVATYNANVIGEDVIDWTAVHRYLLALGYAATEAGVKAYQKDRGLTVDGRPGKITTAALEADMATIDEVLAALKDNTELTKSAINAAEWGGPKRIEGNLTPRFNAIPAAVADELLARRPDPTDGPRHKRFRYHDVQSQLLYAADGGLAAGAQIAALTAAVQELAANRGVDGDALVAAVTTAADRAASEQAAMDVAVDVDQED